MRIGVIGGSGLYELEGFTERQELRVATPFGAPSDAVVRGRLGEAEVLFLARHGRGHRLLPTEVPYRANIYALKQLGAERVVAISAVGSLREHIAPGHLVFIDQFIDRTFARPSTFFGEGCVAHVSFADPTCAALREVLVGAAAELGLAHHPRGTYLCMEGPQFSTRAESALYRSWNADVIGMTNLQEAKLAREAELCYQTVALATDYDCWYEGEQEVSAEAVVQTLRDNIDRARRLLAVALPRLAARPRTCGCREALRGAIMTAPEHIPAPTRERLQLLIGRYLEPPAAEPR
ncbi:MAG: S-methyl-5'-thioadenosine phosphorylase [Planctomycetota bacterium]|nr:MAG: S-methyl-5'-thioadenosine phosphorylase [Planctomycetota bacterium]